MTDEVDVQVVCKGGVVVNCEKSKLVRVAPYFEALFNERWQNSANKTRIQLPEISSVFLTQKLEELESCEIDPHDFLNIVHPPLELGSELDLAPPLPPRVDVDLKFTFEDGKRVLINENGWVLKDCDAHSRLMIHIDRKWKADWKETLLTFKFCGNVRSLTCNEAWLMANLYAPEDIKIYQDRIDLPIFPDLVLMQVCISTFMHLPFGFTVNNHCQMSAIQHCWHTDLRKELARNFQTTPFTTPSNHGFTLYVSGENLTRDNFKIGGYNDAIVLTKYVENDRMQLENPFGNAVRTFSIQIQPQYYDNSLCTVTRIFRKQPHLRVHQKKMSTNEELVQQHLQHDYVRSISSAHDIVVRAFTDLEMRYVSGVCGTKYL